MNPDPGDLGDESAESVEKATDIIVRTPSSRLSMRGSALARCRSRFCIASSSARQILVNSINGSWSLPALDCISSGVGLKDSFSQKIPSILVPLCDPGVYT
jgi:hypothetical protein